MLIIFNMLLYLIMYYINMFFYISNKNLILVKISKKKKNKQWKPLYEITLH